MRERAFTHTPINMHFDRARLSVSEETDGIYMSGMALARSQKPPGIFNRTTFFKMLLVLLIFGGSKQLLIFVTPRKKNLSTGRGIFYPTPC